MVPYLMGRQSLTTMYIDNNLIRRKQIKSRVTWVCPTIDFAQTWQCAIVDPRFI